MLRSPLPIFAVFAFMILGAGCSKPVSYSKDVFPILEDRCLPCHKQGEKGYEASGLNMETYENFMKGTKFGPVVVPGSGFSSTLGVLIEHKADPSINMPHGEKPLTDKQIKIIEKWIDEGALNN